MANASADNDRVWTEKNASKLDPLSAIDEITMQLADRANLEDRQNKEASSKRSEFSADFVRLFEREVRPAMQAIIERLRQDGGAGVIVERPEDPSRGFTHRFTLWMSLSGEIEGTPRQDRHPYLQLDVQVDKEKVEVSEGDLWRNRTGGSSGQVAEWTLDEMTADQVNKQVIEILRRAAD